MSRMDRYRKRCAADGDSGGYIDADNPLPGFIDPITLEPVVTPAISPHGHVMGLATWKVCLPWHSLLRSPHILSAYRRLEVTTSPSRVEDCHADPCCIPCLEAWLVYG